MNRIKLKMPITYTFSTDITIRITDLNYGGHVGNDSFLSLIQEARQQYLKKLGYAELDFEGYGLIMADAAIEYRHELNYGDIVRVSIKAMDFDKLGFDLFYLIEIINHSEIKMAGKAKTGMICYDYTSKKKVGIPERAFKKLSSEESFL
jgi:YbgC/YbaW family acyl-CoA thioester hydrolase